MEKVRKASVQEPSGTKGANTAAEGALRARVSRMGLLTDPAADIDGVIGSIVQAGLCHGISQRWRRMEPNDPDQRQELLLAFHQLAGYYRMPALSWALMAPLVAGWFGQA